MSETMKKRYEDVSATLCAIHGLKYSHCLTREEAEAIESLLDDLMAERGKKINLDEIFPKEATTFCAKPADKQGTGIEYKDCQTACDKAYGMYGPGEYNVVAYQGHWSSKETYRTELARVRVRLGLTVEIVEDK